MQKTYFSVENHGFFGAYFKCEKDSDRAIILMIGDSIDDRIAISAAKWVLERGCNVMTMSPTKKDYGHHNYPLERFEKAIEYLKLQGNKKKGNYGKDKSKFKWNC